MPSAPMHPCAASACPTLLPSGVSRCSVHAHPAWRSEQPVPRIRGRKLQRLRANLFDKHPLCVLCQAKGRVAVATIRDHVIPLAEGGRDDSTNEQPLCLACSDTKTAAEAQRGRARNR